jgi:hypothetical protein
MPNAPDPTSPSGDNFPGFEYLQRVSASASRAVVAHTAEVNQVWSNLRNGKFEYAPALQSWTRVVDTYFALVSDVWRGPFQMPRPTWRVIPFSKKDSPLSYTFPTEQPLDKSTTLDYTILPVPSAPPAPSTIFSQPPLVDGSRVTFTLDKDEIASRLPNDSRYLGFVFEQGKGAVNPLLIFVLHVTP